ncbi:MAG: hypothetical protein JJU05_09715 [Verrucomicrobia bacterium]|nr:hypothetical protein [Verrucomicrobiota bacterium]MCH8527575.1 hypothetical protein [Kiritimatiellia bacterium]
MIPLTAPQPRTFETLSGDRTFPPFDLCKLLTTVFDPIDGCRVALLIDLDDPEKVKDFAFLQEEGCPVQKKAYEVFYEELHSGAMAKLGLTGGELFAYQTTGGSNLDLPDTGFSTDGRKVNLAEEVYKPYDLILCITDYSATAPLTAHAKKYKFRGSTMHGLNDIIVHSGLSVEYRECSRDAEKLRSGLTKADRVEIDFDVGGTVHTLTLHLNGQEAQKSHGLCHGRAPDIANLPAGEVYFVPVGADGQFPMQYESDETIAIQHVKGGRIVDVEFVSGNPATVEAHKAKLVSDPVTGEIGELGLGTQVLPFCGADIQDEKTLGTVHVATGRSDHLGGHLVPEMFAEAQNASHDDILFHPKKTPGIGVAQVRWYQGDREEVLIENYRPSAFMLGLLDD